MWVARDKDNDLWLFADIKPYRFEGGQRWEVDDEYALTVAALDPELFPELTWENEPIEVKLTPMYKQEILESFGELDKKPKFM